MLARQELYVNIKTGRESTGTVPIDSPAPQNDPPLELRGGYIYDAGSAFGHTETRSYASIAQTRVTVSWARMSSG